MEERVGRHQQHSHGMDYFSHKVLFKGGLKIGVAFQEFVGVQVLYPITSRGEQAFKDFLQVEGIPPSWNITNALSFMSSQAFA